MKLLITSPDALFSRDTEKPFDGIIETLEILLEEEIVGDVLVLSGHKYKLKLVNPPFKKLQVGHHEKRNGKIIETILDNSKGLSKRDIAILAISDSDFFMSVNSQTLMLTANYAESNNEGGRLFDYGIPVESDDALLDFGYRYLNLSDKCYYELDVSRSTSLYAINDANTYTEADPEIRKIKKAIVTFLKNHNPEKRLTLLNYFGAGAYHKIPGLQNVKYFGVYPSSEKEQWNSDLQELKEETRKIFKLQEHPELLIRKKSAPKRHRMGKGARINDGCSSQFDSINALSD